MRLPYKHLKPCSTQELHLDAHKDQDAGKVEDIILPVKRFVDIKWKK